MKRIIEHPILGKEKKRKKIKIIVNGKSMYAYKGETIAASLIANGYRDFRWTMYRLFYDCKRSSQH